MQIVIEHVVIIFTWFSCPIAYYMARNLARINRSWYFAVSFIFATRIHTKQNQLRLIVVSLPLGSLSSICQHCLLNADEGNSIQAKWKSKFWTQW